MANIPGPQPDVNFCPACQADLRNIPRKEMKSSGCKRKNGTSAPDTHTYQCTNSTRQRRFEINQNRPTVEAEETCPN
jgi:uncharacterized protein with PIN domain